MTKTKMMVFKIVIFYPSVGVVFFYKLEITSYCHHKAKKVK